MSVNQVELFKKEISSLGNRCSYTQFCIIAEKYGLNEHSPKRRKVVREAMKNG